jgi:hypothetical protein
MKNYSPSALNNYKANVIPRRDEKDAWGMVYCGANKEDQISNNWANSQKNI